MRERSELTISTGLRDPLDLLVLDEEVAAESSEPSFVAPAAPPDRGLSQRQLVLRRFLRRKVAVVSLAFLVVLVFVAVFASQLAPQPLNPPFTAELLLAARKGPSWEHWFGTDELGRDQLTRVIYGCRISLSVGVAVALVSSLFGTALGAIAGYYGGKVDQLLMRFTDLFLVVPGLAILMVAQKRFGSSAFVITVILSFLFWQTIARIMRGVFLSLREREFVEAARGSGASSWHIITRHILPNALGPIMVNVTLVVGYAVLTESTLSFLGFGVQPPAVSWGNMIATSKDAIGTSGAYLIYFPGLALLLTVLAVNFLGDGLRDAFDPQSGPR